MSESEPYAAFGVALAAHMNRVGLGDAEVSAAVGVNRSGVTNYRAGRHRPSADTMAPLVEVLKLGQGEAAELYALAGYRLPGVLVAGDSGGAL